MSTPTRTCTHPEHSYYQAWWYKYCEIDTGCCGFRVSSVVQPQQFAYYFVKPITATTTFASPCTP